MLPDLSDPSSPEAASEYANSGRTGSSSADESFASMLPPLVVRSLPMASPAPSPLVSAKWLHLAWIIPALGLGGWGLVHVMSAGTSPFSSGLSAYSPSTPSAAPLPVSSDLSPSVFSSPAHDTSGSSVSGDGAISSAGLDLNYRHNTFTADTEYKGKIMVIEGIAIGIGKNPDGHPYVRLAGADKASVVLCLFGPGAQSAVSHLTPGHRVRILGKCAGSVNGTVTLGSCSVTT